MTNMKLAPVHPGEVLMEEFLKPLSLSQNRLALGIGVSPRRINEIVLGKRRVTAETALRLARYFDTTPQFWLGLQADYDLDVASDELGERLDREVQAHAVAVWPPRRPSPLTRTGVRTGVRHGCERREAG
jgi:antitoxin HigA-1